MKPHGRFSALVLQYGIVAWEGALERLHASIDTSAGPDACHPWTKSTQGKGYGQLNVQVFGGHNTVHKLMYELYVGEVPEGYEVDHSCHNDTDCPGGDECPHRRCANVRHLEAVPPSVNGARANQPRKRGKFKTSCVNGHEYTPENTMWTTRIRRGKKINERQCKACNRERVYKAKTGRERPADALESLSRAGTPVCRRGHVYDEQNTKYDTTTGKRRCRKCERLNGINAKRRRKGLEPLTELPE